MDAADANTETSILAQLAACQSESVRAFSLAGINTVGKIVDLHDGDTCRIAIPLYGTLQKMTCRLVGVDTPEMAPPVSSPTREDEILAAHRARNFLLKIATNCADEIDIGQKLTRGQVAAALRNNTKIISVVCGDFDKYGRLLVELYDCPATSVESAGVSYNQRLILENYAKAYFGGTKDKFTGVEQT